MMLQISPLTSSLGSRGRFDIPCSTVVRISLTGTLLGVQTQTVRPDEEIVSFDVVSLFTSIPVDLALKVIQSKLESNHTWKDKTKLTKNQIVELTKIVLYNSFFSYEGTLYHQIFGCAMGSPVSVVIADLVMEHVEVQALSTITASPRWWFRYVDDSNACIKSTELDNFHRHLNAVNPHIQFTVERATPVDGKPTIAFLDTNVSTLPNGEVEVQVYRKATHTNMYLAFDSHHPVQHKRSVVSTLMRRANTIPSSEALRTEETSHVQDSLQVNGYPTKFIENAAQPRSGLQSHHPGPAGLAVVPYVQGVSDRVKRTLQHFNIRTAFKPIRTLASVCKKPKDRPSEEKIAGIVYSVECKDCDFSYIAESKRCWASRRVEHDPVRAASKESAIRQHAERTTHDIHPRSGQILERNETNYKRRIFLESLHSNIDKNSVNERMEFPRAYVPLLRSLGSQNKKQ